MLTNAVYNGSLEKKKAFFYGFMENEVYLSVDPAQI